MATIRNGIARTPRRFMRFWRTKSFPNFTSATSKAFRASWVAKIRESMAVLTPAFSANRTVRQYTEEQYIPAATAYARRACGDSELTASFLAWQEDIARHWNDVHFGAMTVTEQNGDLVFEAEVYLGALDPCSVRVELYAASQDGEPAFKKRCVPGPGPHANGSGALSVRDANSGDSPRM